jgi:hypothetical protein
MRCKLLTFLIALGAIAFAVVSPVSAQTPQIRAAVLNYQPPPPPSCTQAANFLARTSFLNGAESGAYTALICGLVSDGIITGTMNGANSGSGACGSILDALYILATNNTTTAALNLCGTSYSLITNGATTFVPDTGISGNGTTGFLNTQFVPQSVTAPNFTVNSASIGAYDRTSSTVVSSTATIIGISSTSQSYIQPLTTAALMASDINTTTFPGQAPNTNRQGAWATSRTSNSTISIYKNGSSTPLATISTGDAATEPATASIAFTILAQGTLSGSVPAGQKFTTDQISAAFIGGALTGTQAAAINNRINAYMTALGVNIY